MKQILASLRDNKHVAAQAWKLRMLKWGVLVASPILAVTWLILLFSDQWTYSSPEPVAADTSVTTPHLDGVVEHLRVDPVYVDPLLATNVADELLGDEVRAAIERSPEEIRLILLAVDPGDDTGGQGAVHLARIVEHLGLPGVYVLIDQNGLPALQVVDDDVERLHLHPSRITEEAGLLAVVDQIPDEMEKRRGDAANPWLVQALMAGVALSVLLWYLVLLVRFATRRDRSYLAGFDR